MMKHSDKPEVDKPIEFIGGTAAEQAKAKAAVNEILTAVAKASVADVDVYARCAKFERSGLWRCIKGALSFPKVLKHLGVNASAYATYRLMTDLEYVGHDGVSLMGMPATKAVAAAVLSHPEIGAELFRLISARIRSSHARWGRPLGPQRRVAIVYEEAIRFGIALKSSRRSIQQWLDLAVNVLRVVRDVQEEPVSTALATKFLKTYEDIRS